MKSIRIFILLISLSLILSEIDHLRSQFYTLEDFQKILDNTYWIDKVQLENEGSNEIVVAVVDSGVDSSHPLFEDISIDEGSDSLGHGTHVAGIIKSIMESVKIIPLSYYQKNSRGIDNLRRSNRALKQAVALNVDIINYSGNGPSYSKEEFKILKAAEQAGILVVVAAGNSGRRLGLKKTYPCSYKLSNIICVGATDKNNKKVKSSNFGDPVHIFTYGKNIKSSFPKKRIKLMTGTSMATAMITGVLAQAMSLKKLKPKIIKNKLLKSASYSARGGFYMLNSKKLVKEF